MVRLLAVWEGNRQNIVRQYSRLARKTLRLFSFSNYFVLSATHYCQGGTDENELVSL